jgi:predicted acetyltransferase
LDAIAFYLKNNWIEVGQGTGEDGDYLLLELPVSGLFSKIALCKATKEDKATIQNLGRFYIYEMFKYCGFLPAWETPLNGLFECIDLSSYCEEPERYAFLIKVDDELAGFVLINKVGSSPEVDWNVGEFFVVAKFQAKGVGRYVAEQIFDQFPGVWETMQIPENKAAINFWEKVVTEYTNGQFEKSYQIIPKPKPHPMITPTI